MNTYHKFIPNVFLAKCDQEHEKGDLILVTTKYGKENECEVYNLIFSKDGYFYYSIVRTDGFNYAEKRAERLQRAALNAEKKSDQYWKAADEGKEFLSLGEPIKIGHHSEKRHRALIERNMNRMDKAVEQSKKAESLEQRATYWEQKASEINLSMPESLEYYQFKLDEVIELHEGLKSGKYPREHSYSLTYAKKNRNLMETNLKNAKILWG